MRLVERPADSEAISDASREIHEGHGESLFHALMDELRSSEDMKFRLPLMALGLFRKMGATSTEVAGYLLGRLQAHDPYDHETFDAVALEQFDFDSPEYIRSLMRLGSESADLTWQSLYLAQAAAMRRRLDAAAEKEKQRIRRSGRT